jgi:hypothetical protein
MALVVATMANCLGVLTAEAQPLDTKSWTEISSPGSGVGGVFFVGNTKQKSVVKFVEESPNRVLFAEAILGLVNVPTPQTVTFIKDSNEFKSILSKITDLKSKSSGRVVTVFENTVPTASVVQLQTLIAGAGGSESVQGVLNCLSEYKVPGKKEPVKTTDLLKNKAKFNDSLLAVNSLLGALSDKNEMELLGRLSIGDAFLGNEDRLQKPALNLNNLMIKADRKFVAIDNFSDAPDMHNLAWEKAADDLSAGIDRFDKKTKIERDVELSKQDWFNGLIGGYRMGSGILTANLHTAMNIDAESQRIANQLKLLTWILLSDLSEINPALMPSKRSGSKAAAGISSIQESDSVWKFTIVTEVSESKNSKDGAHLKTTDFQLDWNLVQSSLKTGMKDATKLIIAGAGVTKDNMNETSTEKLLKGAIGKNFLKTVTAAKGEIDAEALLTRSKYMFLREDGKTKEQIEARMLFTEVDVKKQIKTTLWCLTTERGLSVTKK